MFTLYLHISQYLFSRELQKNGAFPGFGFFYFLPDLRRGRLQRVFWGEGPFFAGTVFLYELFKVII